MEIDQKAEDERGGRKVELRRRRGREEVKVACGVVVLTRTRLARNCDRGEVALGRVRWQ